MLPYHLKFLYHAREYPMKISDLYSVYKNIYSDSSYMIQQKAFLLLMGCILLVPIPLGFTVWNLLGSDFLRPDTVFNICSIVIIVVCIILLLKGKFKYAVYIITSFLIIGACLMYFSKADQYRQSGMNNVIYQFFAFLTLSFLFDSKKNSFTNGECISRV